MEFTNFSHFMDSKNFGNFPAFGLDLLLDSADFSTITKDGGDLVSQEDDKSGNDNHAKESVSKPTWVNGVMNNKAVIRYDGVASRLELTSDVTLAADFSMFVVLKTEDTANTRMFLANKDATAKIGIVNPNKLFVRTVDGGSSDTTQPFSTGDSVFYYTRNTSDKVDVAFNGGALQRLFSDAAQSGNAVLNRVGADGSGFFWDGDIAEIIIYNRALSANERAIVDAYLGYKWGVPVLPQPPESFSGLKLNLDSSDFDSIEKTVANLVEQWNDTRPEGIYNATQGTEIRQFLWVDNELNGKAVLRAGGNDYMDLPTPTDLGMINSDYEIVIVAKSSDASTQFLMAGANTEYELHLNGATGYRGIFDSSGDYSDIGSDEDYTDGVARIFGARVDSNTGIVRVNGVDATDISGGARSADNTALKIGSRGAGSLYLVGDFAHILIFDHALSSAERTSLERWLVPYWGVL